MNRSPLIARWIALGALFIIPFLSLYVAGSSFFPFITGKNFAFRILVEIATAAWLVLAISDPKYRPKFSWTGLWLKLFVVWMFIADLLALNAHKAFWSNFERMDGWVTLAHLFAFFTVAGVMLTVEGKWVAWWRAFLAGSAIVSLYALAQFVGLFAIHQGGTRLDATLGNSEYLAGYLLFAIAIALWQALEAKTWLRALYFLLAALQFFVLIETGTRGTLIGLVGAVGVGSILWMFEAGKRGRRAGFFVLIALLVVVGGFRALSSTSFIQQSPVLSRFATISVDALSPRFGIWHMAEQGIMAKPLHGWGQEGFNYVFNTYYVPSLYGQEPWFDRAHDLYLDWAIAGGIPALVLFLLVLGTAVFALYRASLTRNERLLMLSALAAYAIQGLVVFDNLFTYLPFFAILAVAHSKTAKPVPLFERVPGTSGDTRDMLVSPIVAIAAVLAIWFVNVPSIEASQDLITALTPSSSLDANLAAFKETYADGSFADQEIAEQLASFASNAAVSSPQTAGAIAQYAVTQMAAEVNRVPQDARVRFEYASLLRAVGDFAHADEQIAAALTLSPKKQSLILEAGIQKLQEGDAKAAQADFVRAYALDPSFDSLAPYAAAGSIGVGDIAGGKAILQKAYGTTTVDEQILLVSYIRAQRYQDAADILGLRYKNSPTAMNGLQYAQALGLAGQLAAARAQVNATIALHPEAAEQGAQLLQQLGGK